jgi:hypothetical protein
MEKTHSEDCVMCSKFKELLEAQQRALEEARLQEELELERKESKKMSVRSKSKMIKHQNNKEEGINLLLEEEEEEEGEEEVDELLPVVAVVAASVENISGRERRKDKPKNHNKHKKSMKV